MNRSMTVFIIIKIQKRHSGVRSLLLETIEPDLKHQLINERCLNLDFFIFLVFVSLYSEI